MANKLRLAILGIDHPHGMGWRESLSHVADDLEIAALMPGFEDATTSLEERHAALPRFETVDQLIDKGSDLFDGALICLPNDIGPDAVIQLAQAGKHILLEKPGAANAKDGRRIAEAILENKVTFQSGFIWRYDELANRLREMVADGRFGKIISVEMTWATSNVDRRGPEHYLFDKAQSGGGFFNWLACHHLDLLQYVTQDTIVGVSARVGTFGKTPSAVEDGGSAILDLASGSLATFTGGYWHPRWMNDVRWTIRGTERWVQWEPGRAGTGGVLEIHGPQPQWYATEEEFVVPPDDVSGYGGRNGLALVNDWIQAATVGGSCRNSTASMVSVLELIEAIYQASNEGRRVECSIG